MNILRVWYITSNKWLEFGGDLDHVILGLELAALTKVCALWMLVLIAKF